MAGLLKFAPPESTQSTWDEVAATFAAGRAAQGLVYAENAAWIETNADKSKVVGNVGVALPQLAALLTGIARISTEHAILIAVIAHAGDGNTHPMIVFNAVTVPRLLEPS